MYITIIKNFCMMEQSMHNYSFCFNIFITKMHHGGLEWELLMLDQMESSELNWSGRTHMVDTHLCWTVSVCMWNGWAISVTHCLSMSQFLGQSSHCLELHDTSSCWTRLRSVNITALQEALPTLCVLRYEVNNNAECSTDGCWRHSSVM